MFYRVLGPLEVDAGGEPLLLAGAKQRALLAVLLMRANEVVSRDVLIENLWGDGGSAGSVHSLEVLVSRLRKILHAQDDRVLLTRPTGYLLRVGADELDLSRFERLLQEGREALSSGVPEQAAKTLTEALALWRGKPFEDVAYESFAQVEIERLEERRLEGVEERIEADLALGKAAELASELEALVSRHPQRERLRGQLMLALYRCGRQSEALNVYQAARRELVEELGIEPGPALRQLERAILRQDPDLAVFPAAPEPVADARGVHLTGRIEARRASLIALGVLGVATAVTGTVVALSSGDVPGLTQVVPNSVGVIDPHSRRIVAEIPVGQRPTYLAAVGGNVWVANFDSGTLSQVDSRSRKVVSVTNAGGTPTGLAAGDGSVWVSNGFADRLLRVDERSGRVTATVPIPGHPGAIAVDRNGIWVADTITDTVVRIDPDSLQPTTIKVGRGPTGIVTGDGSVWVANGLERTLTQIDSATGKVVRPAIALRCAPALVAFGAGSIWVTCSSADDVERVDPRAGQGTATVRVGRGPTGIAIVDDRVWVASTSSRELDEIDPNDNAVAGSVETGGSPEGLQAVRGELWAAVHGE